VEECDPARGGEYDVRGSGVIPEQSVFPTQANPFRLALLAQGGLE